MRLHWTDQPYTWHVNDGPEVFVVLDGAVDMHYRHARGEHVERLTPVASATPNPATNTSRTPPRKHGSSSSNATAASDSSEAPASHWPNRYR